MTIKEALQAELSPIDIADGKLMKALSESDLEPSATYVAADHEKLVDITFAGLLMKLIAVSEEREDDLSTKYSTNYAGIISGIYKKWGLTDPYAIAKPIVRQINLH